MKNFHIKDKQKKLNFFCPPTRFFSKDKHTHIFTMLLHLNSFSSIVQHTYSQEGLMIDRMMFLLEVFTYTFDYNMSARWSLYIWEERRWWKANIDFNNFEELIFFLSFFTKHRFVLVVIYGIDMRDNINIVWRFWHRLLENQTENVRKRSTCSLIDGEMIRHWRFSLSLSLSLSLLSLRLHITSPIHQLCVQTER